MSETSNENNRVVAARKRLEKALADLAGSVDRHINANTVTPDASAAFEESQKTLSDREARIAFLEEEVAALKRERDQLVEQVTAAKAGLADKNALKAKVARLETDNLTLHEQIAAHALSGPDGDAELRAALASARSEKKMLDERYGALKSSFAQLEKQVATAGRGSAGKEIENLADLEEKLATFETLKADVRQTLDIGIERIAGVLNADDKARERANG